MRLDHLLSKEHHETHAPPTDRGGSVSVSDSLDGPDPVVGSVLVHNRRAGCGDAAGGNSLNTLLGFETTGPCPLRGAPRLAGLGDLVVALLWWWGVVFDLWIVVASI